MEAKVSIKNLFLLIIPLISWGFLAWFRLERESQLIAYPLSFLFISSIYYFNLKVNKLIFKLSSFSFLILIILAFFSNVGLNFLFYFKFFWIILMGFHLTHFRNLISNKEYLSIIKISSFIRIFLSFSIFLFLIQLSISPNNLGKAGNLIKFTGGWFDGNYFGSFCFLLFLSLNELFIKFKKYSIEIFDYKHREHVKNTLKLLSLTIILTLSLTNIFFLIFYYFRLLNKKIYIFILSLIVSSSILCFTIFNKQTMTFVSNRLLDTEEIRNYRSLSVPELYYQFRVVSLRMRLNKAKDIINAKDNLDNLATHNSFITLIKNIKISYIVENNQIIFAIIIFIILSFIILKLFGNIVGLNFIVISIVLDAFFSGFSLYQVKILKSPAKGANTKKTKSI